MSNSDSSPVKIPASSLSDLIDRELEYNRAFDAFIDSVTSITKHKGKSYTDRIEHVESALQRLAKTDGYVIKIINNWLDERISDNAHLKDLVTKSFSLGPTIHVRKSVVLLNKERILPSAKPALLVASCSDDKTETYARYGSRFDYHVRTPMRK